MSGKKDMRRPDLVVPYIEPATKESNDISSTMTSTLPMAAIFTRNKIIGWTAVTMAVQSWLQETPENKSTASTPAIFSVGMAFMALGVSYMQLFMPPTPGLGNTAAPSATPSA
ncbi:hypothetical protein BDZ85DRAFT_267653 [Elsinoe ampelina]|uniref:Uncharacterized protein n=1 Tax=Elsinoe ampelina TaxID=302913 RepID=A0A6A6G3Q6_9PEZI|nr:hypothetical protein BDZ85DRAFT_267653 [Elsinoe ampelina]